MLNYERGNEHESLSNLQPSGPLDPSLADDLQDTLPPWLDQTAPQVPAPAVPADDDQPVPWRSATVAVLAQVPATLQAAFFDVSLLWLTIQVVVVAVAGLCLVLAEWIGFNRVGLATEQPQPNLERPHPHRVPRR